MLKGVNRNVIEVVDTDSELFERAILFVRPGGKERDPAYLERCAHSFLSRAKLKRRILRKRAALGRALGHILSACLGAGLAALLLLYR